MAFDPMSRKNRLFWNEHAETIYAEEWVRQVSGQVADCLQSSIDWIEIRRSSSSDQAPVKLLDYACGFGVVSTTLFAHADVIRGIDVSDHMVDAYNRLAGQLGAYPQRMSAVQGNVLDDEHDGGSSAAMNGPEFSDVDVVFMTMALHHIQDPVALLSKLVQRLRPGGVLILVDWLAASNPGSSVGGASVGAIPPGFSSHLHATHSHSHGHGHGHGHADVHAQAHPTITRGSFSEQELQDMFQTAGCDESSFALRPYAESSLVPEHVACGSSSSSRGPEKRCLLPKGGGGNSWPNILCTLQVVRIRKSFLKNIILSIKV
ncbi:S-adenosyl-L-methionine-dependent methyltransferase [Nemania sp. FL0031]|nr:S-adenosyl-L-methionine-dependent methyltransferase [Nemania sp. FL0031]